MSKAQFGRIACETWPVVKIVRSFMLGSVRWGVKAMQRGVIAHVVKRTEHVDQDIEHMMHSECA